MAHFSFPLGLQSGHGGHSGSGGAHHADAPQAIFTSFKLPKPSTPPLAMTAPSAPAGVFVPPYPLHLHGAAASQATPLPPLMPLKGAAAQRQQQPPPPPPPPAAASPEPASHHGHQPVALVNFHLVQCLDVVSIDRFQFVISVVPAHFLGTSDNFFLPFSTKSSYYFYLFFF